MHDSATSSRSTRVATRWLALALVTSASPVLAQDTREIQFPDVPGHRTMVVDLHTHSVFSDGHVWPTIRVREAIRDGLDALAITEHLEHQPHAKDIPHPDRNRAFEIALRERDRLESDLLVIPGAEITRRMPPGHANAVFLDDANPLLADDALAVFREAQRQGAFVFWNHPYWFRQRSDGIARLDDMHIELIREGLLHGIEVANGSSYSAEAFQIALERDLAILGVSDIHGLVDWAYPLARGGHRTVTLVLARERSAEGLAEALRARRTIAWFEGMLIGRPAEVVPLLRASLEIGPAEYRPKTSIARVELRNRSDVDFLLRNRGPHGFYRDTALVRVPPHETITLEVKTGEQRERFPLRFEVLRALIAPETHPVLEWQVSSADD